MKILTYTSDRKAEILSEALVTLLSGGTVVYPTETAYALGGDFYSPHTYHTIFSIKHRTPAKPLPVIVPDVRYASTIVEFSPQASRLAGQYWPGPLTLVLSFRYHDQWPHHPNDHLALRVSSHPLASNLSRALGHPLISTSANLSGMDPCYNIQDLVGQLKKNVFKPDLIIDAGILDSAPTSTIVRVDGDTCTVLRKGSIALP